MGPSASARPAQTQITIDDITAALSALPRPREITDQQVARIEQKIFAAAFAEDAASESNLPEGLITGLAELKAPAEVLEGPVPPDYFAGVDRAALEAMPQVRAPRDLDDLREIGDLVPIRVARSPGPVGRSTYSPRRAFTKARGFYRSSARALASVAAVALLAGSTAAAAEDAHVGDFLYPVKLQMEMVRLSLAPSGLAKADVFISIAADRLAALRRMKDATPGELAIATGEMDGAGLGALELLRDARPQPRRADLLRTLYGLARSQQRLLETLLWVSPPEAALSIARSFEVARRIELTTGTLLALPSKSLVSPTVETPRTLGDRVGQARTIARKIGSRNPNGEQGQPLAPPEEPEPEPKQEEECSGLGLICVGGLPIPDLPGG